MNNKNEVKKSKVPTFVRVLALILVVIFVGDLLIANVSYKADDYAYGELEDIAQYIARTDEYINAGLVQRLRNVLSVIGTPETFDELYAASSVALADKDYSKAADYLDKCLEMFKGEDSLLAKLYVKDGCIHALNDEWDKGAEYFEKAAELDGTNADAYLMLAQSKYKLEKYDDASAAMIMYTSLEAPDAQQYELLISSQLFTGQYETAQAACDEALKLPDCDKAAVYFMRCKADFFLEDYPACRDDAQNAVNAGYDYTEGMTMKAAAYEGEKDYAGVLSVLMEIIDDGTGDGKIYQNALTCALEVEDFAAQEKIIKRLLEYETDDSTELTLRSPLAMAQVQLSEFDEALENLAFCLEKQPDNKQLLYLKGICLMNKQQYYDAYDAFTEVLTAGELVDECYYNRAICRLGMGQRNAAQTELNEIFKRGTNEKIITLAEVLMESY